MLDFIRIDLDIIYDSKLMEGFSIIKKKFNTFIHYGMNYLIHLFNIF